MNRRHFLFTAALGAAPWARAQSESPLLVIGHAGVPRVYTGRAIQRRQQGMRRSAG
jgi:hypothetical protein